MVGGDDHQRPAGSRSSPPPLNNHLPRGWLAWRYVFAAVAGVAGGCALTLFFSAFFGVPIP